MSFAAALEQAAKEAVCGWLANGGNQVATTWIVAGARTPATAVASAGAMLGLLAVNYGCNYDPDKTTGTSDLFNGPCAGGTRWCARQDGHPSYGAWKNIVGAVAEWDFIRFTSNGNPEFKNKATGQLFQATDWKKALNCQIGYGSQSPTPVMCTTPPVVPPGSNTDYTYVDPVTNCEYVVNFQNWLDVGDGTARPVLKISAGGPQALASGGIIGGCNFDPVIYVPPGGGGGGGYIGPWLPGPDGPDGEPWWWDVLKGAGGAVLGGLVNRLIDKLLEEKAPATVYRLVSVCETDAQGEPISQSREVSIPQLPILDGLVARVDAMDNLMQGLKDFRQPICPPERPKQQGQWVSVNFVSDERSPGGKNVLRKLFRYRDLSGTPHLTHTQHWENFSWQAGPVCVISKNLEWGVPQVWAATEAEGKRVIAHAAAVSGVNLADPRHEWIVTGSADPRYGQPGTMRVERMRDGQIRVAKRDGPNGLPRNYRPVPSP